MNAPPFEYVGVGLLALGFVGIGAFILVSFLLYEIIKIFKKGKQ
jgi:hypothetical protein